MTAPLFLIYASGYQDPVDLVGPFLSREEALAHYRQALIESGADLSEEEDAEMLYETDDVVRLGRVQAQGGHAVVVHAWSTEHGECYDCGAPAAFVSDEHSASPENLRCAVCAANDAAGGATIRRIAKGER